MNICRTCLKTPANKDISGLEKDINEETKNFIHIMLFCLDIKVTEDSKITTKLCCVCYRKIISFYKFKELSLKNDAYFKTLVSESSKDDKDALYVDVDDIKNEDCSLHNHNLECTDTIKKKQRTYCFECVDIGPHQHSESEEHCSNLENCSVELKEEVDFKDEDTLADFQSEDELLSVIQKVKYETLSEESKENALVPKKQSHPKKRKLLKVENGKNNQRQVCEECGKSVRNMKEHALRHQPTAEKQKVQCKLCPKMFSSYSARYKHNKIKHLGIKLKCDICHKEVVSLSQHKLVMHDTKALRHGCVPCGRRFISQSALELHMTTHTKDRPHECEVCQKKFRGKLHLELHKRQVHDKEKSHLCQFCSKTFFKKYHLQVHIRSHTKEKPYECSLCGKFFSSSSTLKDHRVLHSGLKPFQCEICDMTFSKRGYLRNHMISHTKERRYSCQFCGLRFGRSDHRKRHEWTAHQKHIVAT